MMHCTYLLPYLNLSQESNDDFFHKYNKDKYGTLANPGLTLGWRTILPKIKSLTAKTANYKLADFYADINDKKTNRGVQ